MTVGKFSQSWNVNKLHRLPFLGYSIAWYFISNIVIQLLAINTSYDPVADIQNTEIFNPFLYPDGSIDFSFVLFFLLNLYVLSLLTVQRLRDMGVKIAKPLGISFTLFVTIGYDISILMLNFNIAVMGMFFIAICYLILLFSPPR
ncbi:hypothetical protein [Providencia burhodogranariea]|uniref:Uncharacterized protein n=1 Tax=Providencia burhodogranariea DSM 19968 TaxID=1141662 RepID=K8WBB7_9GAMM|nr:hypothetical protein [Providencia burhodogranariea]EKT57211.1 hypothetical protein OOA_15135 [Providencia burhodogranariea DSM 19968]